MEAENLSIQFGGLKALQELSFSIPEKTVFSIIGPNGAGKTTFFNIVTGIYRPTGGDVRLYGESIVGLEPSRIVERGVCRTFQNIRLFQNLTVLENVMIGRQLHERTGLGDILLRTRRFRAQEAETLDRAAEILDYVGILDDANALAKNLPYGRQRRLEIARALATAPRLLLLLDARGQRTGQNGYRQHAGNGDGIARQKEVELEIGIGKHIVDCEHADQRCGHAITIPIGKAGNQQHRQNEHHRNIGVAALHAVDAAQKEAYPCRSRKNQNGADHIF